MPQFRTALNKKMHRECHLQNEVQALHSQTCGQWKLFITLLNMFAAKLLILGKFFDSPRMRQATPNPADAYKPLEATMDDDGDRSLR